MNRSPESRAFRGTFLLLGAMLSALAAGTGCHSTTAHAEPADWTVERAVAVISRAQDRKFEWCRGQATGTLPLKPESFCDDRGFTNVWLQKTSLMMQRVEFAGIETVRLERRWFFCGFLIFGPWGYFVVVETKDCELVPVGNSMDADDRPLGWRQFFPMWLYPGFWAFSSECAEAIDFMRQRVGDAH